MASSPLYKQHPLTGDASRQIRLLQFSPASDDGIMSCSIDVYDLNTEHDVLSYEWGTAENPSKIRVNDHDVLVSQNLFAFLQVYVKREDKALIWIDQLCIDQGNVEERNAQVEIMSAIYSLGARTLVWLGRRDDDSEKVPLVVTAIRKLAEPKHDPEYEARQDLGPSLFKYWGTCLTGAEREALEDFSNLTYWRRHWIAQEVALSSSLVALYGHYAEIDFEALLWLFRNEFFAFLRIDEQPVEALISVIYNVSSLANGDAASWRAAMEFACDSLCKDPRDKVFGIQYLLSTQLWIDIDYDGSVLEVFLAASRTYFFHSRICIHHERKDPTPDLGDHWLLDGIRQLAIGMGIAKDKPMNFEFVRAANFYLGQPYRDEDKRFKATVTEFELTGKLPINASLLFFDEHELSESAITWMELERLIRKYLLNEQWSVRASASI